METKNASFLWWQKGIIYQVYPRSFQDSNGDGIGDIQGMIQRLDYLKWLGVTIIWLSPVYLSPMKDFGYDISDYTAIHPFFGDLDDFSRLIEEVHGRGMKLIIDHVPNHSSDQHKWFLESRSSRNNEKRDWYIWADPAADGGPPNNWLSVFGGSAWEWDEETGQYYYHAFLKEQPDLNYRNPAVQREMDEIMRFWLRKGVDGFRVDVMWHLMKDKELRNNPPNPNYHEYMPGYDQLSPVFSTDQPEVHDVVRNMRRVLDEFDERMMIGEVYLPIDRMMSYYGVDNTGAHMPFNFLLLSTPWDAMQIAAMVDQYIGALPKDAWPNWVLGNHDQPRIRSRAGLQQSRIAAMLLLTLPGTPTIYYGDELGMQDVPIPKEEIQDPQGLNMPDKDLSRDPARTPMQWDATPNAGFSTARPWLRIDKLYKTENVAVEKETTGAMLLLYKSIIALRQSEPALSTGSYERIAANRFGMAYVRRAPGHDAFLIALNFSHRPCTISCPGLYGTTEIATIPELEGAAFAETIYLSGDEGIIVRLNNKK